MRRNGGMSMGGWGERPRRWARKSRRGGRGRDREEERIESMEWMVMGETWDRACAVRGEKETKGPVAQVKKGRGGIGLED